MKRIGLVGVGVVVLMALARLVAGGEASAAGTPSAAGSAAGVAAPDASPSSGGVSVQEVPEGTTAPAATSPRPEAVLPAAPPRPAAREPSSTREAPPPQEAQAAPPARDAREAPRRRRWRNYNRYPGPIPTPGEWRPPEGPVRIALQVGHWRTEEAPGELLGLRRNGAAWNGIAEWEVNLEIARHAGAMLEELGYLVDILPAVVPPGYRAHLFLAIHADASNDPGTTGYRVAAPGRDATGRASGIVELLNETYGEVTGIRRLSTVTRRMRNYYAFNFRRYEHALHPMTIAAIIETGFLTSARDREIIVSQPERAARGIVEAITRFPITPPPAQTGGAP